MALFDVVEDQQKVAAGGVFKIKPPSTEQWTVHNIYRSADASLIKCKLYSVTAENIGTGDGTTTTFTLANSPVEEESETIYVDGVAQTRGTDYTIDYETGTITFTTAPASGSSITADYQYRVEVLFDSATGAGAWLIMAFHVTNTNYLRVKNDATVENVIGFDGIIVGPNV